MSNTSNNKSRENHNPVNYKKIYHDIIVRKYPEHLAKFQNILSKEVLSELDVLMLNRKIFGASDGSTEQFNQMRRSYSEIAIVKILNYQKKNNLNNSQLAIHFQLSRNTVAKWKKIFSS
ncbi:transposase [Sphingobacterium athyrii]|uniref:Transposase n=1 Tax=Sphingobacterium athyrii TaxID=2152717 RepID=A0A363NVF6_9SPHI|nr:transposase [Sphingobacterium athyrii]PUV24631.1 transposase [Sphingobacterium athyrii]